ncbi:hypothetical protein ASC77_02320 [Nocardioides sp. Root1257]|uniref:response regulator transcription factor n=1 Tax=unclassified Nocardioides TaxID=2615069 RepID=UPI0006F808DC|nr:MULTISPECIES: response regulator transcription factor [unclassified Nocardioides]KQW53153.1 hypothetical protein ASC77_02320 [Nocardioides sp. Root1257]KRC55841.1 hypothetical protein ASE24_02320 [Nocardioides sp. Root224]
MDTNASTSVSTSTATGRRPRVVIIEEHTAVADALDVGLWGEYRVRAVRTSRRTSVAATVSAIRNARPHVAVVASRPGPLVDHIELVSGLSAAGVTTIVLSAVEVDEDPVHWGRCLLAGAAGVLSMTDDLDVLRRMLRRVLDGEPPLCPALVDRLQGAARAAAGDEYWTTRDRLRLLSGRESEVMSKLIAGHGPIEIAREDVVAEATVRTQVKSILAKLEVSSQLSAVAVARRAGWTVSEALPPAA